MWSGESENQHAVDKIVIPEYMRGGRYLEAGRAVRCRSEREDYV